MFIAYGKKFFYKFIRRIEKVAHEIIMMSRVERSYARRKEQQSCVLVVDFPLLCVLMLLPLNMISCKAMNHEKLRK
jgi:hypothetical protein